MPQPIDSTSRVRAFYLGLAGDPRATQVSPQQLVARADGLADGSVDGVADAREIEALLAIARNSGLRDRHVDDLRHALATGSALSIPNAGMSTGPTRFPRFFDMSSMRTTDTTCGCGDTELGTFVDAAGNQMSIARGSSEQSTGHSGLIVRFAAAGHGIDQAPPLELSPGERSVLAPHLVAVQLRESRASLPADGHSLAPDMRVRSSGAAESFRYATPGN